MNELTMRLDDRYELVSLRSELNPRGVGVPYDPRTGRWMAVWGAKGYAEADSPAELRRKLT